MHDKNKMLRNKSTESLLKKALLVYCEADFSNAASILEHVVHRTLDDRTKRKVNKVLLLLLYGEFYGLNTLHKLLVSYGIKSNDYQKLWQSISCSGLVYMLNKWLWEVFKEEFSKRITQSDSTISRQKLTLILDGSIFKQWLEEEEFGLYFSKYYSGQYKSTVYGFNVLLCGMVIGDIFYPLHFRLRKKDEKDGEQSLEILKRVYTKLNELARIEKVDLPTLYFSVDSGFRTNELLSYCDKTDIIYIGVPKSSHIVYLIKENDKKLKIKDLKEEFLKKEAAFHEALKGNNQKEAAFEWRIRVKYQCMGREVTLLLFRLNGSKKVSVIFSSDIEIKAKTMRKHWFERTKIELFFRRIKQDLKIQQTTTRDRLGFIKKLAFAFVKALYTQIFTQIVKKQSKKTQRMGYSGIQQQLVFHQIGKEFLDNLIKT